jgi:mannose-6-phosphate isomerase-like protein (cupin superfamily)
MPTPIPGTPFEVVIPTAATEGRLVLLSAEMPVGDHVDPHLHDGEDQITIVVSGRIGARNGGEEVYAEAGDVIMHPRGVLHELWNDGHEPARVLEIYTPGGYEHVHEARGQAALARQHP